MTTDRFGRQHIKPDAFDSTGRSRERSLDHIAVDTNAFEDPSTFVAGQRRDTHFGKHLQHAFFDTCLISVQAIFGGHVRIGILTMMLDQRLQSQVRMDCVSAKTG